MHNKLFNIVFFLIFSSIGLQKANCQEINVLKNKNTITTTQDTITKDSISIKKAILEGTVKRKATDYERLNQKTKELTLYNNAELFYTDIELKAGIIVLNYEKNEVYAGRIKDSVGNYVQKPVFKQGSNEVQPDSIRFNFKTKKALIWNSRTKQGEMNIKAPVSKRENDSVIFLKNARITTAEDIDDPEYYFLVRKVKFVPKKKVVAGLTNMVIADVPTPIGLPFAYFPMTEKRVSGFIVPTPGESVSQGYFLQNGGYYFALSDYYDLAVLGDYYTNGSYGLRVQSNYAKKYKFNGNFEFRLENNIQSERGFPNYIKRRQYNIQWSHNQDSKASPSSRFSANVNMGSSKYYRQSVNLTNAVSRIDNSLSSSISFSKSFTTQPGINFSVTAMHNQNANTEVINMTLPDIQASVDRVYPFASKNGRKKGLFKNINLQYNLNAKNQITTTDSLFFKSEMFKNAKTGLQHTIPISTNFKVFKHFSVSLSSSFREVWTLNTINKYFSTTENKVITDDKNGFDAFRTYNFSAGIGTTVYGTFNFGENKKIQAIRHIMQPRISYSYTPSFDQYYDTYAIDATENNFAEYTRFEESIFGSPSKTYAQNIGFQLQNKIEAKVTDKKTGETKKITLLNSLNFSTSYNLAADSLGLNEIAITGGTQFFNQRVNLNFKTTLDPYAIDNTGTRINTFNINNGGSLFRMTTANASINFSISSTDFNKDDSKKKTNSQNNSGNTTDDLFGKEIDLSDGRKSLFDNDDTTKKKDYEWYNTKLPWNLRIAYSVNYYNRNRENEISSHSLMFSGNIELAPRWKVGISSGYDLKQKGITSTQLRFERDLQSWRMSFNWMPFGYYSSWGFFIGIRSSMLSDIKWEKQKPSNTVFQ